MLGLVPYFGLINLKQTRNNKARHQWSPNSVLDGEKQFQSGTDGKEFVNHNSSNHNFSFHKRTSNKTVNSSPPYMRQWIGSALVLIMTWRLFGIKSLSEPVVGYCRLGPSKETNFSVILTQIHNFLFTKMHLKISSAKRRLFCPEGDELIPYWEYLSFLCYLKRVYLINSHDWTIPFISFSVWFQNWLHPAKLWTWNSWPLNSATNKAS